MPESETSGQERAPTDPEDATRRADQAQQFIKYYLDGVRQSMCAAALEHAFGYLEDEGKIQTIEDLDPRQVAFILIAAECEPNQAQCVGESAEKDSVATPAEAERWTQLPLGSPERRFCERIADIGKILLEGIKLNRFDLRTNAVEAYNATVQELERAGKKEDVMQFFHTLVVFMCSINMQREDAGLYVSKSRPL